MMLSTDYVNDYCNRLEGYLISSLGKRVDTIDVAHDVGHLKRVLKMARHISKEEGSGHPIVITAASLMHDFISLPKDDPERNLASRMSASHAVRILKKFDYPDFLLADTVNAIEAHSFSANIEPTCVEACIVQDADRMDALGAIGIARCFAVSGDIGRPLFNEDDPLGNNRELDSKEWGLDYFIGVLSKYPDTMKTKTGKKIARERMRYFNKFASRLEKEMLFCDS